MEVSGQLHDPTNLPTGKVYLIPFGLDTGWIPEINNDTRVMIS
jgi:hypothetical protein